MVESAPLVCTLFEGGKYHTFGQSDHGHVTWLARIGFRIYHVAHAMKWRRIVGSLLALVVF